MPLLARYLARHLGRAPESNLLAPAALLAQTVAGTKTIGNLRSEERRSKAGERRLPRHARPADEPCRCPLCESGATAATVAIEEVLSLLEAEEGRAAYAASDGLCGPHAWVALRDAPAESAGWLAADVERRLQSIGAELSRYFAYQRGEDQAYVDSDAWVRATRLVWGESAGSERELSRDAATAPVTT